MGFFITKKLKIKIMKGWIKSIRQSKGIIFLAITDGQRDHQLTLKEGEYQIFGELKVGASFISEGYESVTPRGFDEFVVSKITIVGKSDDEYPIQPKKHSSDFLRTVPELRGRTKYLQSTFKMRHYLSQELHKFFTEKGFIQYWTPVITQADCEGAGETFDVKTDWLEEKLTVSAQLHGEVGMMSLGRIYTFGPCFRAEKSSTKKHLSEFWMVEPEMAFYSLEETIDLSEEMLKSMLGGILKYEEDFKKIETDTSHITSILDKSWIRIKYEDVCEDFGLKFGEDISSDIEKLLIDKYKLPVYVTHWPKDLKPFYMKKDDKFAYCFDLIFPEVGELIGGSSREDDYDTLKSEMIKSGLDMDKMDWYLRTRQWGSVPHAGFGLGFDRLVTFVCKLQKIHDSIPFPISY
jgi:asparaginyl-tRNA synthetase